MFHKAMVPHLAQPNSLTSGGQSLGRVLVAQGTIPGHSASTLEIEGVRRRRKTDADFGTNQHSAANTVIGIKGDLRKMMQAITAAGLMFVTSFAAFAQTSAAPPPAFEVASVKPAPPPSDNRLRVQMGGDAGRVNYSNVTLMNVMTRAYSVKEHQITGPDWLRTERYDIVATVPPGTPKDQIPLMLQSLLADRFKLALHRENKVMPVYALVVGKNGSKLKEAEKQSGLRMSMGPKGLQLTGQVSIAMLADALSRFTDRPVIDMTELKGTYDIDLSFRPDGQPGGPGFFGPGAGPRPEGAGEKRAAPDLADAPTIFTAVQETLGLRLEGRKSPVDILTIDHAEKVPTEN
jgi:uncharacterized protein (TIGR03435 family)